MFKVRKKNLERLIKKYNKKATTIKSDVKQPTPLDIESSLNKLTTRKDIREFKRTLKDYLKKGGEKPYSDKVNRSKGEVKALKRKLKKINKRRAKELKKSGISEYTGTKYNIADLNLAPRKFNPEKIKDKSWDNYVKSIENETLSTYIEERNTRYKENYLKGIQEVGFTNEQKEQIRSILDVINANDFVKAVYTNPFLEISFMYDPIEANHKFDVIMRELTKLI